MKRIELIFATYISARRGVRQPRAQRQKIMFIEEDFAATRPFSALDPPTLFDRRRRARVPLGVIKEEGTEKVARSMDAISLWPSPPALTLVDDILGHWVLAGLVFLAVAVLVSLVRLALHDAMSALVVCCIHVAAVLLEILIALNGLYLLQGSMLPGGGFKL